MSKPMDRTPRVQEHQDLLRFFLRSFRFGSVLAWVLLGLGLLGTVTLWTIARRHYQDRERERFEVRCTQVRRDMLEVLKNGERALRGAAALAPAATADLE